MAATAIAPDGLATPQRYWAAFVISIAVTVSVMDGAMIHVAAPVIARDLGVNPGAAIWVVSAFQFAAAIALLPIGILADAISRKWVYLTCLALFVAGALASAMAPSLEMLAIARFAQGLGGAGIMGVTNAILRDVYPRDALARGLGLNGFVVAMAMASGPMIASLVLALASWRIIFLVAVPIGVVLLFVGARALPPSPRSNGRVDIAAIPLCALAFGAIVTAINMLAHGGRTLLVSGAAAAGIGALGALLLRQRRAVTPLLPIDLLRARPYAFAVATLFAASVAQLIGYISTPFLLQRDGARPLLESGLIFTCWPIAVAVGAPLAGRLASHVAPRLICSLGLGVFAIGLTLLAASGPHAGAIDIGCRMAICGAGYGLFQPSNATSLMTSIPSARAGSASTFAALGRVLGQASGAAVVAYLFRWNAHDGIALALGVGAAAALAGAIISSLRGARVPTLQ